MSLSRVLLVRIGLRSAGVRSGAPRTRAALLLSLAAVVLGGCSTTAPSPTGGLFGGLIATMSEADRQPPQPAGEIEDDGMEGQRPPRLRMYEREDDPTQPFSPNYGTVPIPHAEDGAEDPAAPV
jgi:hypothetical protein